MIPFLVILAYLTIIAIIGSVAFRRGKANTEDFFLASRSIGPLVFFLSLFATNMTAFAILGSSGAAYKRGIGVFGLMASSSGFVIPLTIFFIGTRLWALGKRFGHQTQVQFFRDRWECSGIGTAIFALSAVMLVPYMIVSIMGGGTVLADISRGGADGAPLIPYAVGCAIVALVVTINVFFGGMRGIVWVNSFQTILFLLFGTVAAIVISHNLEGGYGAVFAKMAEGRSGALLARDRIPPEEFWSYTFVPLSSIMFPHMAIMCFSARRMSAFKNAVIAYPIAIMAVWLPCVFLGVVGAAVIPGLTNSDGILLKLLTLYAPAWLAGLLGAGIISAVMGSDSHQVLALSTMFTRDIFAYYGGRERYGERGSVAFARAFVLVVTVAAYIIALKTPLSIFELAVRFAFTGFAAMAPVMVAALFWKRSTKWGALASTVWVACCLLGTWWLQSYSDPMAPAAPSGPPAAGARRGPGGLPGGARRPGAAGAPGVAGGEAATPGGAAGAGSRAGAPGREGGLPGGRRGARAGRGGPGRAPQPVPIFPSLGDMFLRSPTTVTIYGYLPVVPMVLGSAFWMILVSLLTRPPSQATIDRYFSSEQSAEPEAVPVRA
jgi:SSS family solute:Na+ symporter